MHNVVLPITAAPKVLSKDAMSRPAMQCTLIEIGDGGGESSRLDHDKVFIVRIDCCFDPKHSQSDNHGSEPCREGLIENPSVI